MSSNHVTEYSVGQVIEQLRYGGFSVEKIYSRPIPINGWKTNFLRSLFALYISLLRSQHQLEATVFFLAKKEIKNSI